MLFGRAFGLEFSGRGMFVSACCEIGERRRSTVFVSMVQMNLIIYATPVGDTWEGRLLRRVGCG